MASIDNSYIIINDVFQELSEENKRLSNDLIFADKCLKVFINFKTFVDFISDKFKNSLNSDEWQKFEKFREDTEEVLRQKSNSSDTNEKIIKEVNKKHNISEERYNESNEDNKRHTNTCAAIPLKVITKNKRKPKHYVCDFEDCGQKITGFLAYFKHKNSHKIDATVHKCWVEGCAHESHNKRQLDYHIHREHPTQKKIKCPLNGCNRYFNPRYLNQHFMYVHKDCALDCHIDGCNQRFGSFDEFKTHLSTHPSYADQLKKKPWVRHCKKPYVCEFEGCAQVFFGLSLFNQHKKTHLMDEVLDKCPFEGCDYQCRTNERIRIKKCLKEHIKRVHSQSESRVKCDVFGCNKTLKNDSYLKRHKMFVHTFIPRTFKCDYEGCHKAFRAKKELTAHKYIHSDLVLHCVWPGCEYTAHNRSKIKSHENVHKCEKKYVCEWPECGRSVRHKITFDDHMRSHYNDKRHVCEWPGCQFKTVTHSSLSKHRRTHRMNV